MLFDDTQHLTVSEVNEQVRTLLEESFAEVCVLGEVSNFKSHSSGHWYFTLKDANSQLRSVCFRSDARRVGFDLEDGMQVLARGRLTVYEAYGQYQLVVSAIEEWGAGQLEAAFRALKERLEKDGLFDASHKRELPAYPFKIAVVTSPTGAAVRDIVSTLRRRWPAVDIVLCPVRVQGDQAAPEIVRALESLRDVAGIDLIIVGRGGGSLEDLWAFNQEIVARAIFDCPAPVISAVGHETDFTIADFVADARAATPTMAGEMAVPAADEVRAALQQTMGRLTHFVSSTLELHQRRLHALLASYALGRVRGRIENYMQAHDFAMENLKRRIGDVIRKRRGSVDEIVARLQGMDVKTILKRGYTLCSDARSGAMIRKVADAVRAGNLQVTFHDGHVLAEVKEKIHERKER
ncbi:MAG: exodeoxyribonuclease VII large subunit [Candidatus Krumholzibacteria bacterium]|nr:exodeoxyribonuclease VII large subunit [Candidatus Krumholzibacteria bacterium]